MGEDGGGEAEHGGGDEAGAVLLCGRARWGISNGSDAAEGHPWILASGGAGAERED